MMIRAIAIDDEPPALKVIESFCADVDFIMLEKTFTKPNEALKHLRKFPVDLLFLDINMPGLSGLDLYKKIDQDTLVVFTTAYPEFAVEGFNLNALDYLLKPFTFERFLQAVTKAKEFYKFSNASAEPAQEQFLFIRADYSLIKITLSDILYIEGLESAAELEKVGKALAGTPLATTMMEGGGKLPWLSPQEIAGYGFSMIIYPTTVLFRMTRAIERELSLIEVIVGGSHLKSHQRTEAERRALTLASLARTLGEVTRLRASEQKVKPVDADAVPRDLDEFRRTLSRRLEQLVAAPAALPATGHE